MTESEQNLRRRLTQIQHLPDNRIVRDGRTLINFASNDYLGLSKHPAVIQAAKDALEVWGTGSGSSPLLSGHSELHEQFCDFLCRWKAPDHSQQMQALLFPSGYAANLSVLMGVLDSYSVVFCDRKNHASIMDGLKSIFGSRRPQGGTTSEPFGAAQGMVRYYRHGDYKTLRKWLEQSQASSKWVVTDSVFSMDGTIADTNHLQDLCRQFNAGLIVDEAHATGVMGQSGAGCVCPISVTDPPLVVVGTMSKSLGAAGGFAMSDQDTMQRILQSARPLIYSTGIPPATIAAAHAAAVIAKENALLRRKLIGHVQRLHEELGQSTLLQRIGWTTTGSPEAPLLSVIVGDANSALSVAEQLSDKGIFAPAIRPPTVKPLECRIRISPTATMNDGDIQHLIDAFNCIAKSASPTENSPKESD